MVHEVRAIALDLLCASDGTKDNLSKFSAVEWSVGNTTDDLETSLHDCHAPMTAVKNEPGDVLSRHLRKLTLKDVL